jgi:hypothetical protein
MIAVAVDLALLTVLAVLLVLLRKSGAAPFAGTMGPSDVAYFIPIAGALAAGRYLHVASRRGWIGVAVLSYLVYVVASILLVAAVFGLSHPV